MKLGSEITLGNKTYRIIGKNIASFYPNLEFFSGDYDENDTFLEIQDSLMNTYIIPEKMVINI